MKAQRRFVALLYKRIRTVNSEEEKKNTVPRVLFYIENSLLGDLFIVGLPCAESVSFIPRISRTSGLTEGESLS